MSKKEIQKVNAAIAYLCKKFLQAEILFGVLKIQKLLGYAQIYSFVVDKEKFIFGDLQFSAGTYGPLNKETGLEWRKVLNSDNDMKPNLKEKISGIVIDVHLDKKVQKHLDAIFDLKKKTSSGVLADETHQHEPYIKARIKANKGIDRKLAQSFSSELKIGLIDNLDVKTYASDIYKKFLHN